MLDDICRLSENEDPLEGLVPCAKMLVHAQELDRFDEEVLSVLVLHDLIKKTLEGGRAHALFEMLRNPDLELETDAFREILGTAQREVMDFTNRVLFPHLLEEISGLYADLQQKLAAESDGSEAVKELSVKTKLQSHFQHLLFRAMAKKRSRDPTICEEALLAVAELARQQTCARKKIRMLFRAAHAARYCERYLMALDFAAAALALCRQQTGDKTPVPAQPAGQDTVYLKTPYVSFLPRPPQSKKEPFSGLPHPLPTDLVKLQCLVSQFVAELERFLSSAQS